MRIILVIIAGIIGFCISVSLFNWLVYSVLKGPVHTRQKWDLTLCCKGKDGGGLNADIVYQKDIKNFVLINDIYNLPFQDDSFENILCPYTLQKVNHPNLLYEELNRVGQNVLFVIPPLGEIPDSINILQNKHIFLSIKREHSKLPSYITLPFISVLHSLIDHKFK